MKVEIEVTNSDKYITEKLNEFLSSSLGEFRLENSIHEFLIDNGIKYSNVVVSSVTE